MLTAGWRPGKPWLAITAIITMEDDGSGSRHTAHVMHQDDAAREQHEKPGFFDGWGSVITQLDEFASALR